MEPQEIYDKVQALVQKEIANAMLANEQDQRFVVADIPAHVHTGVDSNKVLWTDLDRKKVYIQSILPGTEPATAANYGVVFIAPWICYLSKVQVIYEVASTSGTLQIEKLISTTAPNSGINMLDSTISLSGTANTVLSGVPSITPTNIQLAVGDRIALKDAGTLTNLVGLCVIIELTLT